jgi:predicted PurR-regulated permease PerM
MPSPEAAEPLPEKNSEIPTGTDLAPEPQPVVERSTTVDDDACALSYAGLRRFFFLVISLVAVFYIVRQIASVLIMFVMIGLLAFVLNPVVVWLENRGLKRSMAVPLVVLTLLATLVLVGWLVVPPILAEGNQLAEKMPEYWTNIRAQVDALSQRYPALDRFLPEMDNPQSSLNLRPEMIGTWVSRLLRYTFGIAGAIFGAVIGLLLLVFMLSNPKPMVASVLGAVPARHREATGRSIARIQQQMTAWAKATLINGVITGVSTGVLLHFIGVRPSLVFGVLAFFGEFVPNIGPVVASVPALFVSLGMGTTTFLYALAVIIFVQQVESNLLVPVIMGRSMQLHPVTIVFFALAMGAMLGVIGAILAVPIAAIAKVLWDEFYVRPQRVPVDELDTRAEDLVKGQPWPGQELT